jgi:large subunit ribosomal protein L17
MLYRNLVTELFRHERIQTTTPKAKEARSLAERLITYAKAGDLASRRLAAAKVNDPEVLRKLFAEIGPRYAARPGGYTRILKLDGGRKGDNADIAILELIDGKAKPKVKDTAQRKERRRVLKAEEKAEAVRAADEEQAAEEASAAEATEATEAEPGAAEEPGEPEPPETPKKSGKAKGKRE